MDEQRYLRMRQVAQRLGLGRVTLYKLLRDHNFPAGLIFGRSRRWDINEIDRWAAAQGKENATQNFNLEKADF